MKEIYSDYFLQILSKETDLAIQESDYIVVEEILG